MKPNEDFLNMPLEFWANIKIIGQKLGYTDRKSKKIKIHSSKEILDYYKSIDISDKKSVKKYSSKVFLKNISDYFEFRADFLNNYVEPNLMNKDSAESLFKQLKKTLKPSCPLPLNKQKGDKKTYAYFTCIINMLIESSAAGVLCGYDPKKLPIFYKEGFPHRVLSRRVDGAFPSTSNPIALWEIKEYYSTKTFGSRVADAVYETTLDGMELKEIRDNLNLSINHYLMVDDHFTWWTLGKSYLCRICDILHMGLITEALFGKEVLERVPILVKEWKKTNSLLIDK